MDVFELPLSSGGSALIDLRDRDRVEQWSATWRCGSRGYVECTREGRITRLHRLVLGFPNSMIDHRDLNRRNNCRTNLRICSNSQNQANRLPLPHSSKFKGVTVQARTGKFESQIWHSNKRIYLGTFLTAEEAATAYDAKATELFGDFALLNFS